jgi:hypothetical protein
MNGFQWSIKVSFAKLLILLVDMRLIEGKSLQNREYVFFLFVESLESRALINLTKFAIFITSIQILKILEKFP